MGARLADDDSLDIVSRSRMKPVQPVSSRVIIAESFLPWLQVYRMGRERPLRRIKIKEIAGA
jgi:hypothetical protein